MRIAGVGVALCLSVLALAASPDVDASIRKPTNIPAQALGTALRALEKDRNLQLIFVSEDVRNVRTQGAIGEFTSDEALKALLKGTGLTFHYLDEKTVTIVPVSAVSTETTGVRSSSADTQPSPSEEPKVPSDEFRVAQATPGQTTSDVSVEKQDEQTPKKKKAEELEEVVVTGTRLKLQSGDGPQQVMVYTSQDIDQSGQTTVEDFLNILPDVSVSVNDAFGGIKGLPGTATVQLHGLPVGTTLVLIDGRRVESSAVTQTNGSVFNLNNIPLAAVDRIEVISEGSSAVYGSDAIAGLINIILKKNFNGFAMEGKYGAASGTDDWDTNLVYGKQWARGSVTIVGDYEDRSELSSTARGITSNANFTPFGGADNRLPTCSPGNIISATGSPLPGLGTATVAAVPPGFTGTPSRTEFLPTAGTLNECTLISSILPETKRASALVSGHFDLTPSVQLFADGLFSHTNVVNNSGPLLLFAVPGFSQYTVSGANPYNPFGTTVGVAESIPSLNQTKPLDTNFGRVLVGARGPLLEHWDWEFAAWDVREQTGVTFANTNNNTAIQNALNSTNPATALNPFIAGPPGSATLLESLAINQQLKFLSSTIAANGFIRGTVLDLPTGPLTMVIGGEYDRDTAYTNNSSDAPYVISGGLTFRRTSYAAFTEARFPIVSNSEHPESGNVLALTMAGRFDHYSDFGGASVPQFGLEWRPVESLLVRGTFGKSFMAPSLYDLYLPQSTFQAPVFDPLRAGLPENANIISGGNPGLNAETGKSQTIGVVYATHADPALRLSVTWWRIDERNSIQNLVPQDVVDNESTFSADVIRATSCASGPPCPITTVINTTTNFGDISVAGFDYQMAYPLSTRFGELTPSIAATQTYHYLSALVPGAQPTNRVGVANDDGNWAPKWKATAAIAWKLGLYTANVAGRYVGPYQDYDSTREIGNFWLYDVTVHFPLGQVFASANERLKGTFVELGGINIFNSLPQFSNFGFGGYGYDPAESDIRGRFLYGKVGVKW